MLTKNYDLILNKAKDTCKRAGINEKNVTVIAVSKTYPAEDIAKLYEYGVRDFGENKVQEICDKSPTLPKDINWHLIGHLQRNKVKYIIDKVKMIHSVDSLRLATEIEKEAAKKDIDMDILIQVNVADEDTKFGCLSDEVLQLIEEIAKLPHVHIKGLMTIAPFVENAEENRKFFKELKQLAVDIQAKNIDNVIMSELSMGMTGDFEVAIEEGATLIRVGTAIFGKRNYL